MRNFTNYFLLCFLLCTLSGVATAQCASTLVNNADFEGGFDAMSGIPNGGYYTFSGIGGIQASTNTPDGSATSVQMTFNNGFGALAQTVGGLTENTTYTFSADILRLPGDAAYVGIAIYYRDVNGADIGSADFSVFLDESADWQTATRTLMSPAGTVQAQIAVQGDGVITTDNWCFFEDGGGNSFDCPGNLVGNGSLDNDTGGWFTFAGTGINGSADAYAGAGAGAWDQGAQAAFLISDNVVPGNMFSISAWIKSTAGQFVIGFRNQDAGIETYSGTAFTNDGSEYQFVINDQLTIPEGTDDIIIFAQGDNAQGSPGGVFDNVCVQDLGPDPNFTFPITLASFAGEARSKTNLLTWTTATEENTAMFYLQRSADGRGNWDNVAEVTATGNSREEVNYTAEDHAPLATGFYRLRSVDYDGAEQLSDVISIARAGAASLSAFPNPFAEELAVRAAAGGDYLLLDLTGRTVRRGVVPAGTTQFSVPTADLPAGQYVLRVGGETVRVIK